VLISTCACAYRDRTVSIHKLVPSKARNILVLAASLVACIIYAWQVETVWTTQDLAGEDDARIGLQGLLAGHNPDSMDLSGTGVAKGASGTLYFYNRGVIGVLQLHDMPLIPTTQVFQMWCVDATGNVDASSVFRVPFDGQEFTIVDVSTPHILGQYTGFLITIEPAGGSATPSSQVVMVH
jgi:hypothetical protein